LNQKEMLQAYPSKRVFPVDGMAVTADVWQEAHAYHRRQQQFHAATAHGPGIITGLEVIGSDPADSSLYIRPGLALDTHGQTVVLPEPMAYDLGEARGTLYLLLTHSESHPRPESDQEDGPHHIYVQFGIEAVSDLPETAHVELARIRRQGRDAPIVDAKDRYLPGPNEIDLRFRRQVGAQVQPPVVLGVSYTGGTEGRRHGQGVGLLARSLRTSGQPAWFDDGVPLGDNLSQYAIVCLVGDETFQLSRDEMNALYAYLQGGGILLVESCRHTATGAEPPADASFFDLFASMGVETEELSSDHPLLQGPYLFSVPPPGFETEGTPQVLAGDGVIFSTCDYGCLWGGERRSGPATRDEIRTAMEWGSNIVAYALGRQGTAESEGVTA
jgi:hypothetical protein